MEPTEPKSWKWIQGIVVVMAVAIGIGIAVWYQGRPVDTSVVVPPTVTPKKVKYLPARPYVTPSVLPSKPAPDKTASAAPGSADDTTPVPSQSSVNNWQKDAVDPSVHLQIPAANGSTSPYGVNTTSQAPPSPYGIPAPGAPGAAPSPYTPSSADTSGANAAASPSSSSSPSAQPFGGTTVPTGTGTSTGSGVAPGTGPVGTGGAGTSSDGTSAPAAPTGTGGTTTGL